MTHKVHPKMFRIKGAEDFNVRGFYGNKMTQYLEEDFLIKDFIRKKFAQASIANVEIEHSTDKLSIIVETARPGLIIGRGGEGIEILKKIIERKIRNVKKSTPVKTSVGSTKLVNNKTNPVHSEESSVNQANTGHVKSRESRQIKIDIREVKNPWTSSMLVAQMTAQQIEKRIPFRQVLKKCMERVMQNKEIKGIKIEVAGRLNGIEIARKEWLKLGRMPLQTIRANIEYAQIEAYCTYGVIGVKVWMYKGDRFE